MPALPLSLPDLSQVPLISLEENENFDEYFSETESVLHKNWPYSFFEM